MENLRIDGDRLWASLMEMARIGATPKGGVCRLAATVITADGRVTHDERLVYDHALARWRINQSDVTHAILDDRVR